MSSRWIFIIGVVFLASAVIQISPGSALSADTSSVLVARQDYPMGDKTDTQKKPYTMKDPGPWPAKVAKTHSPIITYEKSGKGLTVTVKIDNHPMDPKIPHYIMWIRLEDGDGNKLGEITFKPSGPAPIATFHLAAVPRVLKALEQCNIHGIWMSEVKVVKK